MMVKNRKKKILLITLFLFLLIFIQTTRHNFNGKLEKKKIFIPNLRENIFDSNKFIVNGYVTQYSSVLSYTKDKYEIETMNFIEFFKVRSLRCLVWSDNIVYLLPIIDTLAVYLMQTKYNIDYLFKLKCSLEKINLNLNNTLVSLIDVRNFNDIFNHLEFVQFQRPVLFDANVKKKKSFVNCVHTVNNIDQEKEKNMLNWIQYQKKIGYDKLVMYFMNVSVNFSHFLNKKFSNFVQIIDHQTSESEVCGWHRKMIASRPNNMFVQTLMDHCLRSIKVNFEMKDQYIKNSHERLCSNDCLMKSKYEYEYLTNYDFDEFIFPRVHNTKILTELSPKQNCSNETITNRVNMYEYVKRLESIYGNNIASFLFENVNMLTESYLLKNQLTSTNKFENLRYKVDNLSIELTVNSYKDKHFLDTYRKNFDYFECMNSTIATNNRLQSKWNNYFGLLVNNRYGKSIYNTNLTLSYNQHYSYYVKWNSFKVSVSLYNGFVSHFRDSELDLKKRYSVQNLIIDSEYYEFLYKNYNFFS